MRTRVPAFGAFAGASDGSWFATLDRFEAVLRVWDIPARHDSSVAAEPPQPPKRVDRARHAAAADPGWSPTVADDGHTVRLRDPATGQVWASLSGHATAVDKCVPTPDGSHVVTICADGVLRLWDTATRTVRTLLTGQESTQLCAIDPDGAWLATDSRDGDDAVIRLWDSATGHLLHTSRFYGQISELVAGPNGAWLAWRGMHATQRGVTVVAWTISRNENGALPLDRGAELDGAGLLSAAPDGRWVALVERPYTLGIWDTATWKCVAVTWLGAKITRCDWPSDSFGPHVTTSGAEEPVVFDFSCPDAA